MARTSITSIYQQNNQLEDQLQFLQLMQRKERNRFLKEVKALVDAARHAVERTKSQQTKIRLLTIIETWENFLRNPKKITSRNLHVISGVEKTSLALSDFQVNENAAGKFIRNFSERLTHLVFNILSPGKIDVDSPVSEPRDPELRAIYDELFGTIE